MNDQNQETSTNETADKGGGGTLPPTGFGRGGFGRGGYGGGNPSGRPAKDIVTEDGSPLPPATVEEQ